MDFSISSAFKLMSHWSELKRAYDLWNQIQKPFTEMIDIIRHVGAEVGALDPEQHANPIAALKASPLGRFNMKWVQETLAMSGMPGGTPNLKTDGVIGDSTHAAIKKFQQAHPPLDPDSWAGLQTLAALEMERKKLEA